MALLDARGIAHSTGNRRSLDRFELALGQLNGFYLGFLETIDEALAEDPDFVGGHLLRAGVFAITNERSVEPELRRSLDAAQALAGSANERERAHMAALRAWAEGDLQEAADRYSRLLVEHPRDHLALQIAHQADFFLGDARMLRDRVAWVLPHWDRDVPGYGYLLGMHAFGLEQMNLYGRAEEAGRSAVELNPRDTWAIHAVAHVLEMQGRTDEGTGWLETRARDWSDGNAFAFHNWWHLALYYLDQGDTRRALGLYDERMKPGGMSGALEMVDSSALLWRLHLRGIGVGDRWRVLADEWERAACDGFYAFNDAHAMMAFAAEGRTGAMDRTLAALQAAAAGTSTTATMAREVGLPVARAFRAFGEGEYRLAAELLLAVRGRAHRFGGSHAQRDVLDLTLAEAAIRAGDAALARAVAAERTDVRPSSPANWLLAARAYDLSGEHDNAELARRRAGADDGASGGAVRGMDAAPAN
ncbi:tetratricopeptide repeat protein [Arenibaculum pallidiluteum]|uniref:tetratricopeptide repeat protein n=1 Tax=Arenibaculum pallidiluteum TaxID=2812559 RepID=UPI001A978E9A|nr:tetratricopeptide repeat protein [Arenibaculum pallidiluteum]